MNSEPTSKILIPRRLEGRRERYIKLIRTQLQQKHIEGNLDLTNLPEITDLGNVETVSGDLDLNNSNVESLGNLQKVGGYIWLSPDHKIPEELMIEYRKKFKILGQQCQVNTSFRCNQSIEDKIW